MMPIASFGATQKPFWGRGSEVIDTTTWRSLEDKAHDLRRLCLETVIWAGSGHIGGSLSAMDILTVLYHHTMNYDAQHMDDPDRDRFVLSKGHIGVGFAPVLADLGCFPKEWLKEYNHTGSPLGMHPDAKKVPGVEVSTGSLGHGLCIAAGMAAASQLAQRNFDVYCLLGDGECDEGSVWEAAMAGAHFNLDHLCAIVDRNRAMIDGMTEEIMALEPFADKWRAFGWHVIEVDGHSIPELAAAFDEFKTVKGKPTVVIANTVKGEGIDFIAGDYKWHYGAFGGQKADEARVAIDTHHQARLAKIKEA